MKSLVRIWLLFFVTSLGARGQAVLTLDQCLALARERSPRLQSVRNSIRSTELSHDELMTTRLPQLRLQASPILAPGSTQFGYDPAITDGGQLAAQITLQQSLYDGGVRGLRSDQIHLDLERLSKQSRKTARDLTFDVKRAFYDVYRTVCEAALLAESVQQLGEYFEIVRRLEKGGSASLTDVLKTELQLANARISHQRALDDHAVSKYSLAELIGADIDTSFSIEASWDPVPDTTGLRPLEPVPDSAQSLELAIADLEVKRTLLEVEMTQRERLPNISLTADAGYLTSGDNLKTIPPDRYRAFGFSLGILVDLPLITWGSTSLRVEQRQLEAENLRLDAELLRRGLIAESRKTRLQIARVRERLRLIRLNRTTAEENFLLTRSKFVGGGTLSLEVLAAQQLLTETNLAEVGTQAELQFLMAKVEQLTTR